MIIRQSEVRLRPRPRGVHLVTRELLDGFPQLADIECGLVHVFLCHTSASITLNENADPDVLRDMNMALDRVVPEAWPYAHTCEGPDDMPAHVKATLVGSSLTLPICRGSLALGTWQGIYLCEHRDHGGARRVVLTAFGEGR